MTLHFPSEILDAVAKKNSKTNLKSKWLFIVGAFVVLFVIFYAALPKQTLAPNQTTQTAIPTPGPATADWKTYSNTTYNFSIKYPSDWTASEVLSGPVAPAVSFRNNQPFSGEITLYIEDNPQKLSSEEFVEKEAFKNDLPEWENIEKPHEIIQVDGRNAVWFDLITGGSGDFQPVVYLTYGDKVFYFQGRVEKDIFNQILSTFKFTK